MADSNGTDRAPPEVSKESIRKSIWDHIEAQDLANFPRPVTKRIPNFKGAEEAAVKAAEQDAFKKAQTVKINPDKPQQHSRYLTIEAHKSLLVPTPRLRTGLFNKIIPPEEQTKEILRVCSTSQGVREHSVPLGLDANIKIDLVIVGSVAVSRTGLRIGKGEGFADLEFAMMMTMGAITPQTLVVTTVHDCQVKDIPESLMGPHDLCVDIIVTPTQVIECKRSRDQPRGIIWSLLAGEKLDRVPILKKLRLREFQAGKDVRLKDEEAVPSLEALEEADRKVDEDAEKEANDPQPPRYRRRFFRGRVRMNNRNPRRRRQPTDGEEADGEKGSASESDSQKKPSRPRRPRRQRRRTTSRGKDGEGAKKPEGETEGSGDENQKGDRKRPYRRRWKRRPAGSGRKPSESGDDKENAQNPNAEANGAGDRRQQRRRPKLNKTSSLYVGNIPKDLRVSEFKSKVRALSVTPLQVIWHGNNAHAFLVFAAYAEVEHALSTLEGMQILEQKLNVQLSKRTQARHAGKAGGTSDGQTDE